jgi:hypothetical protein
MTVLNWARPRDLSHYEQFEQYHAVFYRFVEALSVTPFAPRALERGLTGVMASLIRLHTDEYNPNPGAALVRGGNQFPDLADAVAQRARDTTFPQEEHITIGAHVLQETSSLLDHWAAEATVPGRRLVYSRARDAEYSLLREPGNRPWDRFTVPTSMREVEPGVGLLMGSSSVEHLPVWQYQSAEDDAQS